MLVLDFASKPCAAIKYNMNFTLSHSNIPCTNYLVPFTNISEERMTLIL